MKTTAAVLNEPGGAFALEDIDVAQAGPGEIRVAIHAVGICHTDLVIASGAMGNPFPMVLGHEGAGIVESVGEGVHSVKPGDKVLLSFNSCGRCARCEQNKPAYCAEFLALNMGTVRPDGSSRLNRNGQAIADNFFGQSSFAGLAVANERNVLKLADDADLAVLAPLGCGIQTGVGAVLRSLGGQRGEALLVIGGGAVGLSALLGGVIVGCDPIVVIEPRMERREMAMELGATAAIDPAGTEDIVAAVRAIHAGGFDMIVDTSGHMPTLERTPEMIATLGRIGLVGVPGAMDAVLPVPVLQWLTMGGTVRGVVEGDSDIAGFLPELIGYHAAGRLPYEKFVRYYPFEKINEAVTDSLSGDCIKPVLTVS